MARVLFGAQSGDEARNAPRVNVVAVMVLGGFVALGFAAWRATASLVPPVAIVLLGLVAMRSPRIAQQWASRPNRP